MSLLGVIAANAEAEVDPVLRMPLQLFMERSQGSYEHC